MNWFDAYFESLRKQITLYVFAERKSEAARLNQKRIEEIVADRTALREVLKSFGKDGMCGLTIFTTTESAQKYIDSSAELDYMTHRVYICDQCTVMRKGKKTFHVRDKREGIQGN